MSENTEAVPSIPLRPEDQARLDKLADELVTAGDNLFVVDLPTAFWVREQVSEEQFQHAITVAEANHGVTDGQARWAVDLGDGTLLNTQLLVAVPVELVEEQFTIQRFSDPVPAPADEYDEEQAA